MASTNSSTRPLLNLQRGWPSTRLCARQALLDGAREVLADGEDMSSILLYGPNKGYSPLCQSIATWLSEVYNPSAGPIDPRRILVTNGASASLANVALKYTDPSYTRRIFMVEPTYFLACPIFIDCGFQGKLRGIPEGFNDDGIDVEFLYAAIHQAEEETGWPETPRSKTGSEYPHIYKYVLYCTTTHSNPSGKTMPKAVRETLIAIARKYDILLISDDVYDVLRWSTADAELSPSVPLRLCDLDREIPGTTEYGNAISNGSFSKLIGPGIRVGWVEGTPSFASALGLVGSSSSGGAPAHFASTIVERTLRSGDLQNHIRNVLIPEYRLRSRALDAAIETHLSPLGYRVENFRKSSDTAGGYFTYIRLPPKFEDKRVFARTLAATVLRDFNLRIAYGHMFVVAGDADSLTRCEGQDGFGYCMRLSWAWHEPDQIEEAVQRLADCTREARERLDRGEDVTEGVESIGVR